MYSKLLDMDGALAMDTGMLCFLIHEETQA